MDMVHLKVNGQEHDLDVPEDMPLLWVLRDVVGLTGTKFGCGIAQCGACTVHLDGKPVRSCVLPVAPSGTRDVTTVEAVGDTPRGQEGAGGLARRSKCVQCGYCQSGQIMSAAALLARNPEAERRRHRRRHVRQYLPLRHLSAHPRGDQAGERRHRSQSRMKQRTRLGPSYRRLELPI